MHFINLESSLVKYDNAYFESSALLIIEVAKSSVSYKLKTSSVKLMTEQWLLNLILDILILQHAIWHIVIECYQKEVDNLTTIEIYENGNKVEVK